MEFYFTEGRADCNYEAIIHKLSYVSDFNNNNAHNIKINGLVLDMEPWAENDSFDWLDDYLTAMQQVNAYCKQIGIKFNMCIPGWFDSYEPVITQKPNFYKEVIDLCDEVSIMNYVKTSCVEDISNEVEYAKSNNKTVISLSECQPPVEGIVTEDLTYYYDGPNTMLIDWYRITDTYDYKNLDFGIHDYRNAMLKWLDEDRLDISKSNMVAQYKFDKSIYDNLIPEFNAEFTNYEIVDEYLDTEDIVITSTETMLLMNYDAEPDEYGILTTEYEVEHISELEAIAPDALASSIDITSVVRVKFILIQEFNKS